MSRDGKLTLDDLMADPTDDFILDDWDDSGEDHPEPHVWWARILSENDRVEIAKNRARAAEEGEGT